MVFPSLHYARLDDPTYLARRHQPGGALPSAVGPPFPSRAWGTLHALFARVLSGRVSPLIECEKGFIMPMSLRQIGRIIDEAFPDLDNMYERMDIIELRNEATAVDYDFGLWWDYVRTTRELANEMGLSMRTLDRALWAYSKAKQ